MRIYNINLSTLLVNVPKLPCLYISKFGSNIITAIKEGYYTIYII